MTELFVLMAVHSNEEKLVKELEEAIQEWKMFKDEDRMKGIIFQAHLLMIKDITKGDMKKAMEMIKDMKSVGKFVDTFVNNKN
jgi:hypothetical protein